MTTSKQAQLDAVDPLPCLLNILKILRTTPDDNTALIRESSRLKDVIQSSYAMIDKIPDGNISVIEQKDIIDSLERKIQKKRYVAERHELNCRNLLAILDRTDVAREDIKEEAIDDAMVQ
ncbi:hypothetical protein MRB53_040423 [Persea americana]|nr:hypothetical protein MRB53_040423 [Persea americana]